MSPIPFNFRKSASFARTHVSQICCPFLFPVLLMSRKIVPEKYTLHWLLVMLHFVCLDGKTPQSRRTTRDRMKRKRGEFGAVFAAVLLRRTDAMRVSRDPREKSGKSGRNLKIRKSKRRLCRPQAPSRGCESVQNYTILQFFARCSRRHDTF